MLFDWLVAGHLCDLRHNIAVWQGYGLIGGHYSPAGVSRGLVRETEGLARLTHCQVDAGTRSGL
jgi:hypothetical protein